MKDFPLIACGTGSYKAFSVLLDGWPPKSSLEDFKGANCARMASQTRGVTPLDNLGAN